MSLTLSSTATHWQLVIRDLQGAGYTYERIAIAVQLSGVDYSRDAVKWLASGRAKDCSWQPGQAIMTLHAKVMRTTSPSEGG